LAWRAGARDQRTAGADVPGGPAPAAAGGGRRLPRRRAPPARGQARPDRPLAGVRPLRPALGGSGQAGPAVRGELVVLPRPDHPAAHPVRGVPTLRSLLMPPAANGAFARWL